MRITLAPLNVGLLKLCEVTRTCHRSSRRKSETAWFLGSNPAEGMDVRLLCLLCAV